MFWPNCFMMVRYTRPSVSKKLPQMKEPGTVPARHPYSALFLMWFRGILKPAQYCQSPVNPFSAQALLTALTFLLRCPAVKFIK